MKTSGKQSTEASIGGQLRETFAPHWALIGVVIIALATEGIVDSWLPQYYKSLVKQAIPSGNISKASEDMVNLLWILVVATVAGLVADIGASRIGQTVGKDLRLRLFTAIQCLPVSSFIAEGETVGGGPGLQASATGLFNNELMTAHNAITYGVPRLLLDVVKVVAASYQLIKMNGQLAIFAFLLAPLYHFASSYLHASLKAKHKEVLLQRSVLNERVKETLTLSGISFARTFGAGARMTDRFKDASERIYGTYTQSELTKALAMKGLGLLVSIASVVFMVGGMVVLAIMSGKFEDLEPGNIIAIATLFEKVQRPLTDLMNIRTDLVAMQVCFASIFLYIARAEAIEASNTSQKPQAEAEPKSIGRVKAEALWFRYPIEGVGNEDSWALSDVGFVVEPGERIAIVGVNGSGKTTLAYLLAGMLSPTRGRLSIDGLEPSLVSPMEIGNLVGLFNEEPLLFNDSVLNNFKFALPGVSLAQVRQFCDIVGLDRLISSWPEGYETRVGEKGLRLSSGERHKLAFARLLLKKPRILLLDEFNSHLDPEVEAAIDQHLRSLGCTVITITHRITSAVSADRIIVMEKGHDVEMGTHDELLKTQGVYARLLRNQIGEALYTSITQR